LRARALSDWTTELQQSARSSRSLPLRRKGDHARVGASMLLVVRSGSVVETTGSEHRQRRGGAPRFTRLRQAPPASSDDARGHRQRAGGDRRSPRSVAPIGFGESIPAAACLRRSAILHAALRAPGFGDAQDRIALASESDSGAGVGGAARPFVAARRAASTPGGVTYSRIPAGAEPWMADRGSEEMARIS
jgi:hypothetical protein